jgi:hypothetical protein
MDTTKVATQEVNPKPKPKPEKTEHRQEKKGKSPSSVGIVSSFV